MTPDELSELFDLDLDPRTTEIFDPPHRDAYLRLKRLQVLRHYDSGWADRTYLECYGVVYSST